MRPVLGALASIVLTGAAVAAPILSDPNLPKGADPSGETPHAPARRPAARLVVKSLPKPVAKTPVAKAPVAKAPAAKNAVANKATAKKPVVAKLALKTPVAKKPLAHKPLAKKPTMKAPVVKKPIVASALAKKPVAKPLVPKHAPFAKAAPVRAAMKPGTSKPKATEAAVKPPFAKRPAATVPKKAVAKAAPVRIGAPNAERGAVQSKYDAMSLLIMRRDGNRLAALFLRMTTPDFVYRDKKGKALNRNQLVGQLRAQMKMVKAFKRSGNKIVGFGLKGATGSAQLVSQFAMVFQNGKKGVTVSGESVTSDTWIKTAKGWKLRAIRTLRESVKYNGKAV